MTIDHTYKKTSHAPAWYYPMVSPEHGVYIVLLVSFLTGTAAVQQWNLATTLALICALAGLQAEYPLVLQIKQRRSCKPRFILWGVIYSGIAFSIAGYLYFQKPILIWLYLGTIVALLVDAIAVFFRQQKSVINEFLTFAAVCLAAPFAYISTSGTISIVVIGLWLLNTLFFASAIFTVKLRKPKTESIIPGLSYHGIASVIIIGLWYFHWLAPITALSFVVALIKFGFILFTKEWYQKTKIGNVAILETLIAFLFLTITALSLLPAHLHTIIQ